MKRIRKRTRPNVLHYLLITFLCLLTGGYATYGLFQHWPYFLFIIFAALACFKRVKISKKQIYVLVYFFVIIFLQRSMFGGSIASFVLPCVTMFVIMMMTNLVAVHFKKVFVNVIVFFSLVSLVFWCINLTPSGQNFLEALADSLPQLGAEILNDIESSSAAAYGQKTLYFYSILTVIPPNDLMLQYRNSGPFWEPGMFTVFLVIALIINIFTLNKKVLGLKNVIIVVTILTTLSTTAYVIIAFVSVGYILSNNSKKITKIITLLLVGFVIYECYDQPFLAAKIIDALDNTGTENSRFGAMLYHINQIQESPLIGYGQYLTFVFGDLEMSPCGWTELIRYWGIPTTIFIVTLLWKTCSRFLENTAHKYVKCIVLFTTILLVCFPQSVMYSPFLTMLYFIGTSYSDKKLAKKLKTDKMTTSSND